MNDFLIIQDQITAVADTGNFKQLDMIVDHIEKMWEYQGIGKWEMYLLLKEVQAARACMQRVA